jgi:Flp pilus assembly protein TadG
MRRTSPSGSAQPGLQRDRRASTALEFAIVAFPFTIFLVFLLELGYDFFAQVALNYGVQTAARQIQIGTAQGETTAAKFQTDYLCPALNGLLPCSSVTVNVFPIVSDYYTSTAVMLPTNKAGNLDTSGFTYCPGKPNQLMLVEAIYTSPSLVSAAIPSMATATAGGLVRVTLSSTAFINENFPVTAPAPAGC